MSASGDFSFHFFKRAFNTARKFVACAARPGFSVERTASAIMSEMFIALKVNIVIIDVLHTISSAS